jgi:hypothetical protein
LLWEYIGYKEGHIVNKTRNIAIFILLLLFNTLYAQDRVTINDYGVYLVQNGAIKEIHTQYEVRTSAFWGKYIILEGESIIGACIYNMETETISDWIWGSVVQLENGEGLIVYVWLKDHGGPNGSDWIYTYDPDTLVLKNEVELHEEPFPDLQMTSYLYYGEKFLQRTKEEIIGDRLYRYKGENFYLDINYGANIDLTGKYLYYPVSGGIENIFIVRVHKVLPYK